MKIIKKIRQAFSKTRESLARKIDALLSKGELDDDFYDNLEEILISSDVGVKSSIEIVNNLRIYARKNKQRTSETVKETLKLLIADIFKDSIDFEIKYPCVITIVGVNGVGKTTTIGKLAAFFKKNKKEVIVAAGDTFRAAASLQLDEWAKKSKVKIVKQNEGADAASVVFDSISSAKAKKSDVLIVDTAGRLHTKLNLMEELKKINNVITREYPEAYKYNFIVLDATTGQNALNQITVFNDFIKLDGIILTKLDGTAKGGVLIRIKNEFELPVLFIGAGEKIDDIERFDAKTFVDNIFD